MRCELSSHDDLGVSLNERKSIVLGQDRPWQAAQAREGKVRMESGDKVRIGRQ